MDNNTNHLTEDLLERRDGDIEECKDQLEEALEKLGEARDILTELGLIDHPWFRSYLTCQLDFDSSYMGGPYLVQTLQSMVEDLDQLEEGEG